MERRLVRVHRVEDIAVDIKQFELVTRDQIPLEPFTAGSHIDVVTPSGLVRQYSLCNDPADRSRYIIAVKKESESRGASLSMHNNVSSGDLLEISSPRNNFPLSGSTGPSVLLAGGIGVTPILAMAHELSNSSRPFFLHYFVRSLNHAAFSDLLESEKFSGTCEIYKGYDAQQTADRIAQCLDQAIGGNIYVCGPAPFIALAEAKAAGRSKINFHTEYFSAPLTTDLTIENRNFNVKLLRQGVSFNVPANKTIIEELSSRGIRVDFSCEQGVCGTCLTHVVSGVPDHRDAYLTEEEKATGDQMLICVSRCKGTELVLDL